MHVHNVMPHPRARCIDELYATIKLGVLLIPRRRSRARKRASVKMSLGLRVVFLACVLSLAAGISIAPGDEERDLCKGLRDTGAAPIPGYAPNMRVLMDSWNYRNLLPTRIGDVWDQVDNDNRNNPSTTTNVS